MHISRIRVSLSQAAGFIRHQSFFLEGFSVQVVPELLIDKFLPYGHYFLIACFKIV
jgi:hypothetical protein